MPRFLIYRHQGSLGSDSLDTGHFVFLDENDVKVGRVNPRMNPMLGRDPEEVIEADSPEDAERRFRDRRGNMFQ